MTKVIFITHGPINDFSYGGPQRANHLRNALISNAQVDTLVINGGDFYLSSSWSLDRIRVANVFTYGFSLKALRQRLKVYKWISLIISEGCYDFIVVQYLDLAMLVPKRSRSKMIYDPDDFIKTMVPRANEHFTSRLKLWIRNSVAQRIARQALHVWYVNPRPNELPNNVRRSFMPNVVRIPDPTRQRKPPIPRRLLMVGLFVHKPNLDGLSWFCKYVLPRVQLQFPDLEIHAVGYYNGDLGSRLPFVNFRGFVEDLTVEYDSASVLIAPVLSGGGSQIKVIDALVHERPLVASKFAYSGFACDLVPDEHLLVADSVDDWVSACSRLLSDPSNAEAMAKRGAVRAAACYGPERMVQEVNATLTLLQSESNK